MSPASATLTRPPVGDDAQAVNVRQLHRALRAMTKRDAVTYLRAHAGVTRSWAERHLARLGTMHPEEFGTALAEAAAPSFMRQLRTLDPTGDTAARNVDHERAEVRAA